MPGQGATNKNGKAVILMMCGAIAWNDERLTALEPTELKDLDEQANGQFSGTEMDAEDDEK